MNKHIDVFLAEENEASDFVFQKIESVFAHGAEMGGLQLSPHTIKHENTIFKILFTENLSGERLKKMEEDWRRYCSH